MERMASESAPESLTSKAASRITINGLPDVPENPFASPVANPLLDPHHQSFSIRAWLTNLTRFTSSAETPFPHQQFGVSFHNLSVSGSTTPTDYQKTVSNIPLALASLFRRIAGSSSRKIPILHSFDGLIPHGELLLVLGRPGSGCSTLLKTISGDIHGLTVDDGSHLNYQGIPPDQMRRQFRGEAIYMAEHDVHFPQLTVDQTLSFAAKARAPPSGIFPGVTREVFAERLKDVALAAFGLMGVKNTNVGSEMVRGVSGGERKRVSIAEAMLSGAGLQCWDNSTRGLDSVNAVEFCKTLRVQSDVFGSTSCVAIYQAPQAAYDVSRPVLITPVPILPRTRF